MKRWQFIIIIILMSMLFVVIGQGIGNVPETQHNGATLCLSCIGLGK